MKHQNSISSLIFFLVSLQLEEEYFPSYSFVNTICQGRYLDVKPFSNVL